MTVAVKTISGAPVADATANLQAEIDRLRAENARLAATKGNGKLTCKVSAKGALSVYGVGRFPVTLYKSQWPRLLDHGDSIRQFILDNDHLLAEKGDKYSLD